MSPEQLAEIEARAAAATPGPWEVAGAGGLRGTDEYFVRMGEDDAYNDVAIASDIFDPIYNEISKANAAFIAHARADVPALVAEVRRLRKENEDLARELTLRDENVKWTG